jgi:hypothetical protein
MVYLFDYFIFRWFEVYVFYLCCFVFDYAISVDIGVGLMIRYPGYSLSCTIAHDQLYPHTKFLWESKGEFPLTLQISSIPSLRRLDASLVIEI